MYWLRWPKVSSIQPTIDVPSSQTYCWREPVNDGRQRFLPGYSAPHSSSVIASAARTGAGTAAIYSWNSSCSSARSRGRASNTSVRSTLKPGDSMKSSLEVKRSNAARLATSAPARRRAFRERRVEPHVSPQCRHLFQHVGGRAVGISVRVQMDHVPRQAPGARTRLRHTHDTVPRFSQPGALATRPMP